MIYKIASFNMRRFGAGSAKDIDKIAEIIIGEDIDVVALQEIFSEGKGVRRMLEQSMKHSFYNWDFCFASPRESADLSKISDMISHDTRGEGYAYMWNKRRFKLLEYSEIGKERKFEPRIINSLSRDVSVDCTVFARTPYYIRLEPMYGGFFELRLINIHVYYGDNTLPSITKRKIEHGILTQNVYPEISKKRYGQFRTAYTIAMGDYNLNLFTSKGIQNKDCCISEIYTCNEEIKNYNVITMQDELTTLKSKTCNIQEQEEYGYANNYDHFTYSPELSNFVNVSCEAVDVVQKYCNGDFEYYRRNISDHLPIVMTVEI